MTIKSEDLVNLIYNKFKNYKRKKIFLERENFHKFILSLLKDE